jgi:hypothetical protein
MNNSEIEKTNISMADFLEMGKDTREYNYQNGRYRTLYLKDGYWLPVRKLKFNSSWEWLMPVVCKIEQIENGRFGFTVDPWSIEIIDYFDNEKTIVDISKEWEKGVDRNKYLMGCYYEAVNIFLEWHKTNKLPVK